MHDEATHRPCDHADHRARPSDDARRWDAFYAGSGHDAPRWSGMPNGSLTVEVADLRPGTALDVGCGEGADAIWLAHRGWDVTALDPSAIALERAASAAAETQATVAWIHGGLAESVDDLDTFDLVSVQYGVLPLQADPDVIRLLCRAVAPGGTLLVVHHELGHDRDGHGAFEPANHVLPAVVAAHLGDDWRIETYERRDRPGTHAPELRHVRDLVLRARRRAAAASP